MSEPSFWTTLAQTVASEFSDVPDPAEALRILLRLALALLLGFLLGYERESEGKSAGVRTHMLVALGSALFVLLPSQMGMAIGDLSRMMQGVVTGIGFLCAGTILKYEAAGEERVHGLTTAAGLWLTAAIGMACGLGREVTAIITAALAMGVFMLMPKLVKPGDTDRPRPEGDD